MNFTLERCEDIMLLLLLERMKWLCVCIYLLVRLFLEEGRGGGEEHAGEVLVCV